MPDESPPSAAEEAPAVDLGPSTAESSSTVTTGPDGSPAESLEDDADG